ncbi:MAG: VanZ family protein [bacterium]|jgi:VanZ family protein|nr:VanZ family protein [Betaproteobacteria bacterium]
MNPAGPDTEVVTHVVTDFRLAQARESRLAWYFAGAYLLVIVYASLSPFSGWATPGAPPLAFLDEPWPRRWQRFDLFINAAAYLPLGLLLTLGAMRMTWPALAVVLATLAGAALSLVMETAQMYLPARVASSVDLIANTVGTLVGALLAARTGRMPLWAHVRDLRYRWCLPGRVAEPGLALVAIWFLSQLDPSLPLMSLRALPDTLPIPGTGFIPPSAFSVGSATAVAINTLAVCLFVMALVRRRWHALAAMLSLLAMAALIKFGAGLAMLKAEAAFIWLSDEVLVGIGAGAALAGLMVALPRAAVTGVGIFVLCLSFLSIHLYESPLQPLEALWPFRWNYGQLLNYTGLARTVAELWPLVAALYLFRLRRLLRRGVLSGEGRDGLAAPGSPPGGTPGSARGGHGA